MKTIKRVQQDDLAGLINQAVELEAQRIERIEGEQVDGVDGGVKLSTLDPFGPTMGLIAIDPPFTF